MCFTDHTSQDHSTGHTKSQLTPADISDTSSNQSTSYPQTNRHPDGRDTHLSASICSSCCVNPSSAPSASSTPHQISHKPKQTVIQPRKLADPVALQRLRPRLREHHVDSEFPQRRSGVRVVVDKRDPPAAARPLEPGLRAQQVHGGVLRGGRDEVVG